MARVARWFVAVTLGLVGAFGAATPASADELLASIPDARQELTRPPGWVTLAFDAPVDESVAKILVTNAAGQSVTQGAVVVEETNMRIQLNFDLPRDTYTVKFRTNADDGDAWGGAFQFSYGPGAFSDVSTEAWSGWENEPPEMSQTDDQGNPVSTIAPNTEPTATIAAEPDPSGEGELPGGGGPIDLPTDAENPGDAEPGPASPSVSPEPTVLPNRGPVEATLPDAGIVLWVLGGLAAAAAAVGVGVAVVRRRRPPGRRSL